MATPLPHITDADMLSDTALGKKPMGFGASTSYSVSNQEQEMTPSTPGTDSPTKPGVRTRQKRVLPARSRRGGPGVGSCEVDAMILETQKRRLESEPLIPGTTNFLLTTNSKLLPSSSDSSAFELNTLAFGRYFDRPEVRKAYIAQQVIQTPEFVELTADAIVGARFRPRGSEDETADTSDATYEKRHRKYETFEKRQRLREKEKLKHDQYKLKERIEQLRAMDTSAFLALPAADFPNPAAEHVEAKPDSVAEHTPDELGGMHPHGTPAHIEGERRRQEMLQVAMSLEERYHTLLPPDRRWIEREKLKKAQANAREYTGSDVVEVKPEEGENSERDDGETSEPMVHKKEAVPVYNSDGEAEVDLEERDRERSKTLKLRIKFPPRKPPLPTAPSAATHISSTHTPHFIPGTPFPSISPAQISVISSTPGIIIRSSDGKFLPKSRRYVEGVEVSPIPAPRKKPRLMTVANGTSASSISPVRAPYARAPRVCMLMLAAQRNASAPTARKTQRHVTAFGARLPPDLEDLRDFDIPLWVRNGSEASESSWRGFSQGPSYSEEPSAFFDEADIKNEAMDCHDSLTDFKDDLPPIAVLEE